METREGNEIIKCGHGDCHVLCIFMIVNERRKWYNKKNLNFVEVKKMVAFLRLRNI